MKTKNLILEILAKKYEPNSSSYSSASYILNSFLQSFPQFNTVEILIDKIDDLHFAILTTRKSQETKRKLFYIFALLLQYLKQPQQFRKFLRQYMDIKKAIINERQDNVAISKKEAVGLNVTLRDLRKHEINKAKLDQQDLLFNLLIHIDETPRLDYRLLKFNLTNPTAQDNYINRTNEGWVIVLNNYKTSAHYDPWHIQIKNPLLVDYLDTYFAAHGILAGDWVFKNKRKNPYPHNKFSEYIQRTLKKYTGIKITNNTLRKIKENDLFFANPKLLKMSVNEEKEYPKNFFRHSLNTARTYYKRVPETRSRSLPRKIPSQPRQTVKKKLPTPTPHKLPSITISPASSQPKNYIASMTTNQPTVRQSNKISETKNKSFDSFTKQLRNLQLEYGVGDQDLRKLFGQKLMI